MHFLKSLLCLSCALLLCSCSSDSYEKYIGLWEGHQKSLWDGSDVLKILEITKEGDSFLAKENILVESKAMLLSKNDNQLLVNTGIGSIPIAFGADKDTLLVEGNSYKRITQERVDEIKSDIKKKKEEEERKKILCKDIITELNDEIKNMSSQKNIDSKQTTERKNTIVKKYKEKYTAQGCSLNSFSIFF